MNDLKNLEILLGQISDSLAGVDRSLANLNDSTRKQQAAISAIGLRVAELEKLVAVKKTYSLQEACRVMGINPRTWYRNTSRLPDPILEHPLRFSMESVQEYAAKGRTA
ncbi:MAG TPA: hypothetical protein VMW87_06200 [Spirochaetia bacterium]|nr:hypothetical protein [Spirochaetia bacterium]